MDQLSGAKLIQSPQRIQTGSPLQSGQIIQNVQNGSPIRLQSIPQQQILQQQPIIYQQPPQFVPQQTISYIPQPQQPIIVQSPTVISSKVEYPQAAKEIPQAKGIKPLECLICLIPIILAIIILICSIWLLANIKTTQNLNQAQGVIRYVNENQKTFPINAIKEIGVTDQCPQGFVLAHLGVWHGIEDGCLCENDKEKHRGAACLIKDKCQAVKEIGKTELNIWVADTGAAEGALPLTQKVCVKRAETFTKLNEQNFCAEGFIKCGTFGCVQKDTTCPLNTLKLVPTALATDPNVLLIQKAQYQFSYTDNSDMPFIGFDVSAGLAPCFDQAVEPEFQSHKWYPYARQPESGCSKEFGQATPYFQLLGTMTEFTVFNVNSLQDRVKALPFFGTYFDEVNDKLNLLVEKRIASSSSKFCEKLNVEGVDHIESYASHFQNVEKGFAITLIVLCSIMILIGIFFAVVYFVKGLSKNPTKSLYILFIILVIICVIVLIVYAIKINTLNKATDVYQTYQEKKCFGDAAPINDAFKSITSHSSVVGKEFKEYSYLVFWFAIAFLILAIVAIFLKRRQNLQEKVKEPIIFEKPWN